MRRNLLLLVSLFLLSCSPKLERTRLVPIPESFSNQVNSTLPKLPERWWEAFGSRDLNILVEEVVKKNHELKGAWFRIKELSERLKVARSYRFPEANIEVSGRRERIRSTLGSSILQVVQGNIFTSYEVDIWRRFSSSEKEAFFKLISAKEARLALLQSLVSEAVAGYVKTAFISCELALLREEIKTQKLLVKITRDRFLKGIYSLSELLSQEEKLSALEAQIPELERRIKEEAQNIEILLGGYPSGNLTPKDAEGICSLEIPPPPPGIPSELIKRRPDIRAAEAKIMALAEEVKAKRALRFPRITLTTSGGRVSDTLSDILSGKNKVWSASIGIGQYLFNAGRLKAEEEASKNLLRRAEEELAQRILRAFKEVELGLINEGRLRKKLKKTEDELLSSSKELYIIQQRYAKGILPLSTYLYKKIQVLELRRKILGIRLAIILNRVFLYKALGGGFGGWEKRSYKSL